MSSHTGLTGFLLGWCSCALYLNFLEWLSAKIKHKMEVKNAGNLGQQPKK